MVKKFALEEIIKIPKLKLRKTILNVNNFCLESDMTNLKKMKNLIYLQKSISERTEEEMITRINFKNWNKQKHSDIRIYEKLSCYLYSAGLLDKHIVAKNLIIQYPQIFKNTLSNGSEEGEFEFNLEEENKITPNEEINFTPSLTEDSIHTAITLGKYKKLAFGGSFDHMHIGHNLLLTTAALACSDHIYIGLTSDEMLGKKDKPYILQPFNVRADKIKHILDTIGFNKKVEIKKIDDQQGGAGTDASIDGLLLTEETKAGGEFVNNLRVKNGLKPLDLVYSRIILEMEESKISSRNIRGEIKKSTPDLDEIYKAWMSFCIAKLGIDIVQSNKWFSILRDLYSQPWRKYHNLNHIHELLKISSSNNITLKDEISFYMCLWFHDAIYTPSRSDNEERSAELFTKFHSEINTNKIDKDKVIKYIMHTKLHTEDQPKIKDKDLKYFLDCDLSILGSETAKYKQYINLVQAEYSDYVDKKKFKGGRKKFLVQMLTKIRLYYTEEFYDKFEFQARENLVNELNEEYY